LFGKCSLKEKLGGSETTPHINQGKGDTLAQRAVSLLHRGQGRIGEDLEGDKQPPAPDQDLWLFNLHNGVAIMSAIQLKASCLLRLRFLV